MLILINGKQEGGTWLQGKKHLWITICMILVIALLIPIKEAEAESAGQKLRIATDSLNVRTGPGLSYASLGMAARDETYTILDQEGDWYQIDFESGQKGWVANWLVVMETENKQEKEKQVNSGSEKTVTINADGLRVRGGPSTDYRVVGVVSKGKEYKIVSTDQDWFNITTEYGNVWVHKDFVQVNGQTHEASSSSNEEKKTVIKQGVITGNSLNVRTSPDTNSKVIGKLNSGTSVDILSQENDWTEISFQGTNAWISSQYIQAGKNQEKKKETNNNGTITASSLNVREKPSLNGNIIGSVAQGDNFRILKEENNWTNIELPNGTNGWVASWYVNKDQSSSTESKSSSSVKNVTILHNGSNIRQSATTNATIVARANQGDTFEVVGTEKDWYEIKLGDGQTGFIAGWIVSNGKQSQPTDQSSSTPGLKNKVIVLDPGHGGRDNGTTGASGTLEKTVTIRTAEKLAAKLKAAGATVIFTRQQDTYVPLQSRVSMSHMNKADAFISIHYDSINDRSVRGMTTYYYHDYQQQFAADVHQGIMSKIDLNDRGYRHGDYYVIRENNSKAILLELGYLSNATEEIKVTSEQYQEAVSTGIFQGLRTHFQ